MKKIGLFFYQEQRAQSIEQKEEDLNFGSSGGGGAENANDTPVEFGQHQATREDYANEKLKKSQVQLIDIHILEPVPVVNAVPVPKKEEEKPKIVQRKKKPRPVIIAENLPIGHVRHGGQGPGSGGGAGGGSGGGIGARIGYAIDWGGTGSRRLLSGRIPKYPDGTDKQMVVVLKFSVLPDGSVNTIIPTKRTDELLEHAAITALQTWRFDPLPSGADLKSQVGVAKFNFKYE